MLSPSPDVRFGPWTVGDTIAGTIVVPYVDETGAPVDLTAATVDAVDVVEPDGTASPAAGVIDTSGAVEIAIPSTVVDAPGVWSIVVRLSIGGTTERPAPLGFVVEDVASGWLTLDQSRGVWRDAPANDAQLWRLLDVARSQVEAWAIQPVPDPPTSNLLLAQQMQARNVWNAAKTDPAAQGIGDEGFVIRPYPMDPVIKDIIRPKRPRPVVA